MYRPLPRLGTNSLGMAPSPPLRYKEGLSAGPEEEATLILGTEAEGKLGGQRPPPSPPQFPPVSLRAANSSAELGRQEGSVGKGEGCWKGVAKWHPGARSHGTVMTCAAGVTTIEDTEDAAPSRLASRPDRGCPFPGPWIRPEGPLLLSSRQGGQVLLLPLSRAGSSGACTGAEPRWPRAHGVVFRLKKRGRCAGSALGAGAGPAGRGLCPRRAQARGGRWGALPVGLGSEPRSVQSAHFVSLSPRLLIWKMGQMATPGPLAHGLRCQLRELMPRESAF